MPIAGRLLAASALLLWLTLPGAAQSPFRGPPAAERPPAAPRPEAPAGAVTIGALLPLSGHSAWFGKELRQGMELAVAELAGPEQAAPGGGVPRPEGSPASPPPAPKPATGDPAATRPPDAAAPLAMEEMLPGLRLRLTLETRDVETLDTRAAVAQFGQLAALGVPVVLTASPTPTLAIYPTAAARDILVVHQGLLTSRLPATSRTLLHVRPSVATRAEALVAYARGRGAVRLGILASGDEFGRAVRAVAAARWRAWGLALVQDESVSLQTPDLGERLRRLVRLAPDALLLGLEGPDLGDVARRAREAGYPGFVLALDDDPAVALAAGPELEPAVVLAEAFVAEPGTRAERFAEAYRKKFGGPPSRWAAQGYEAVAMIADGVRAAREGRGGPVGGARLRDALVARRSFPALSGGRVVLRDDGSVVRPLGLFAASGGRLTFVRYVEGADGPAGARP